MTTATLNYRAIHSKITSVNFPIIKLKIVYLTFILLSLLMLVFYVYSVNQLTKGTLIIKNYYKEIGLLTKENRSLEISLAEAGFLGRAAERAGELSFEKTKNIKYIQILEGSLAKAK